ncbi:hypothetical protein CBL_01183 [Carabus blaptoides fortunei]
MILEKDKHVDAVVHLQKPQSQTAQSNLIRNKGVTFIHTTSPLCGYEGYGYPERSVHSHMALCEYTASASDTQCKGVATNLTVRIGAALFHFRKQLAQTKDT